MFNKITSIFKSSKPSLAQLYQEEHQMEHSSVQGYSIDGVVLNEVHAVRLELLSNRRVAAFDDLKALYNAAMIINEKIDLEIASGRFNASLGNTEENLQELKRFIGILNGYYRNFMRDQK